MRNSVTVVVPKWGKRDAGKMFLITEKSAFDAQRWAARLFFVMKGTAGYIPDELEGHGMIAVAIRGINAVLAAPIDPDQIEPLMDELMDCVQIIPDPRHPDKPTPIIRTADDIEEPQTIFWLQSEVIKVHTGFSFADALLSWATATRQASAGSDLPTT